MTALLLGFALGIVSGLRTFTPLAAVLIRRGSVWGIVLAVAAVAEYVLDLLPNTPARTGAVGLTFRIASGAWEAGCSQDCTVVRALPARSPGSSER